MPATTNRGVDGSVWRRLGWFALIWCASLAFWAVLAYAVKLLLGAGG
jgi:hypothetical protein